MVAPTFSDLITAKFGRDGCEGLQVAHNRVICKA